MPKKKKPKAVMVDGVPIKPISPAEHRRLDNRIKRSTKGCPQKALWKLIIAADKGTPGVRAKREPAN